MATNKTIDTDAVEIIDPEAVEIGKLFDQAKVVGGGSVTDKRKFSRKISPNRNGSPIETGEVWRQARRAMVLRPPLPMTSSSPTNCGTPAMTPIPAVTAANGLPSEQCAIRLPPAPAMAAVGDWRRSAWIASNARPRKRPPDFTDSSVHVMVAASRC